MLAQAHAREGAPARHSTARRDKAVTLKEQIRPTLIIVGSDFWQSRLSHAGARSPTHRQTEDCLVNLCKCVCAYACLSLPDCHTHTHTSLNVPKPTRSTCVIGPKQRQSCLQKPLAKLPFPKSKQTKRFRVGAITDVKQGQRCVGHPVYLRPREMALECSW